MHAFEEKVEAVANGSEVKKKFFCLIAATKQSARAALTGFCFLAIK
jgi:hypothetical protein